MSADRYFDHLRIPKDSPLTEYLGISPGEYSGKYDSKEGKLFLKKKGGQDKDKILSGSVSLHELLMILSMAKGDRGDKFTKEEQEIVQKIKRSSNFSGTLEKPHHHIIPIDVCRRSKLVTQAIKFGVFDANSDRNKRPLKVTFHSGSHPKYSNIVETMIEKEWSYLVRADMQEVPDVVEDRLTVVIDYLNKMIDDMIASGICSINNVWDL
ncbi:AHH domain-containing protein [Anabaena sp. PCC 7108]|uniref:AHH domain-containing protein n=1 Tax=Anabaena sp. PCC 7108 TaxID=163908 RepID=UPI00034605ED|nr:AHH domain-containing protein [Anabaena sp. PCC 7108]